MHVIILDALLALLHCLVSFSWRSWWWWTPSHIFTF